MLETGKIRVLVADDLTLVREGLTEIVRAESDMIVVGEACDGIEAVDFYRRLRPDVLVLDLKMPRMDGFEALETIRAFDTRARILVLTGCNGDQCISHALTSGSSGYLHKSIARKVFVTAIREVHRGILVIPPDIAGRVAEHLTSERLTSREVQVLQLMGEGKANKAIAYDLGISEGTVKTHVLKILGKLDCWSRLEAVRIAYRRGFLWPNIIILVVPPCRFF